MFDLPLCRQARAPAGSIVPPHLLLQARHPRRSKMAVLEAHPVSDAGGLLDDALGQRALALTEADEVQA